VTRKPSFSRRLGPVPRVARLLGIRCDGRTLARCPRCGAHDRNEASGRLARHGAHRVSVTPSGWGWRCAACMPQGSDGSSADLLSCAEYGRTVHELSRDALRAFARRVDHLAGTQPTEAYAPPTAAAPRHVTQGFTYRGVVVPVRELYRAWLVSVGLTADLCRLDRVS